MMLRILQDMKIQDVLKACTQIDCLSSTILQVPRYKTNDLNQMLAFSVNNIINKLIPDVFFRAIHEYRYSLLIIFSSIM